MKRRAVIAGLIMVGAWPVTSRVAAQEARREGNAPAVIRLVSPFSRTDSEPWHQAFRKGLRDLGWVEGENLRIEYRFSDGRDERLPALAADLIALNVDLIVVTVTTDAPPVAKATKTSRVEILKAAGIVLWTEAPEVINLGVEEDVWLKVRIDDKEGWIHTQEDFDAIGLPQAG